MSAGMVECGVCQGSGDESGDPFRICGHCVGAGQLTASGRTSRTALQAMDYAAAELGGNGYDIVMEARAAVAELIEAGDFLATNGTPGMVNRWNRAKAAAGDASRTIAPEGVPAGLAAAAEYIQKKADAYAEENCGTEWDTGATTYHFGQAGEDYHHVLLELAEEIAALANVGSAS